MKLIFEKLNPKLLAALVVTVLAIYVAVSFIMLARPRGLIIHAPKPGESAEKSSNSSTNRQIFAGLNPEAFSASFGLDFQKKILSQAEKPAEETVATRPAIIEAPLATGPKTLDLFASGYRLKGIVLEKDGNSAAFVYEPTSKKVLVVREKAGGEENMRIVSATMRSVQIATPQGVGMLELEDGTGGKTGGGSLAAPTGYYKPAAAFSQQTAANLAKSEKLLREANTSANSIADMISAGHFQVRPEQGNFKVDVKKIPDSFAGYGLRAGDTIIGTADGDFKQSAEVANKLGSLSERPSALKIQRGRQIIYLKPPPPTPQKDAPVKQP
ncbi:MAG: hypothetical protein ACOYXC_18625 [Candidatus Rifleibacteriota bacterium]